ncbi:hypothetical protein [Kineococcus rubinsiae]|uniref:hypothetical protein n=1 Tax=Kineococcus rubinsiae TaxID=2609562 RepID=UPI00142FA851|nr:hypothetical protein [Kineococcus rubinsiae]NIZ90367.1 hypothetical protein [Kineococcus rubinsiae]
MSEAPTRGEATSFLPTWVPTDARSISLVSDTRGRGKTVQLSTAESGVRGDCTLTAAPSTDPFFSMQLPAEVRTAPGLRCLDGWFVAQQGTHLYAWTVAAEREGGGLLN